jgi:benzylsuccinate CoA-transferase BbsE subunit
MSEGLAKPGALEGVRVLHLLDGMGEYAGRLLRGLGADVVRMEPPGGSTSRNWPWAFAGEVTTEIEAAPSLHFLHYHAGMRGITLDPSSEEGLALLTRLLDQVNIVLDNGQLARWGFDLDGLAAKSPALVVVSLTPFGLTGERAGWQGTDLVCQAMSGMLGIFGYYDERPARFGVEQASEMGGLAAALGALIALYGARHNTDPSGGEVVDISVERVCALVTLQMWNASMFEQFDFRRDRLPREDGLPVGLYEASDGFFALGTWREIERTMGMLEQTGFADGLRELWDELGDAEFIVSERANEAMTNLARSVTRAELLELVQAANLTGLPVNDASDLVVDSFLQARGTFVEVEAAGLPAPLLDVGAPVRMDESPWQAGKRPPLLGEHNAEVFGAIGLSEDDLEGLRTRGVV